MGPHRLLDPTRPEPLDGPSDLDRLVRGEPSKENQKLEGFIEPKSVTEPAKNFN